MATTTTVPKNFGSGGAGLTPNRSSGKPSLEEILRDHETNINNATGAPLSSSNPAAVGAAAAPGVATSVSRQDHVHADPQRLAKGADLTDASPTITVSQGFWRVLPAATLSAGRTVTLGTSGAAAGDQLTITRLDVSANTLAVVNGGAGAGTLITFPVSKLGWGKFQFDGTNWALREFGMQP